MSADMKNQGTSFEALQTWVEETAALCSPKDIVWCDGSQQEWDSLTKRLCDQGTFLKLNPEKRPNSFLARSAPSDVARVEERTFICTKRPDEAGPTNQWADPIEMRGILDNKFRDSMAGRTMYVIPFCMGPLDSPLAKIGIQCTDRESTQILSRNGFHFSFSSLYVPWLNSRRLFPAFPALSCSLHNTS